MDGIPRGPNRFTPDKGFELLGQGRTDEETKLGTPRPKVAAEEAPAEVASAKSEAPLEEQVDVGALKLE